MSVSVAFQDLILSLLTQDSSVSDIVSDRVFDGPQDNAAFPYISFGPSDYNRDDADCVDLREETVQIDCWTRESGKKWPCKQLVDAVERVLRDADGELTEGGLVSLSIGIVRILDDPDGITIHGVVQVTGLIED